MHTLRLWRICAAAPLAVLIALLAGGTDGFVAQSRESTQSRESVCDIQTTERVVAIGDVHGAYNSLRAILQEARLIDARDRWTGGRALLIQTGDVLDRGPDSKRAIDLLRKLEREAQRAGGRVYALLGNHELMRLLGDWRYLSPEEIKAFVRIDSEELREVVYKRSEATAASTAAAAKRPFDEAAFRAQFLKEVPLGLIEMRMAFEGPMGEYGQWVRARPTMVKVNGIAFLHGGVSDIVDDVEPSPVRPPTPVRSVASLGCDGINAAVTKELASLPIPLEQVPSLLSASETGPLWYRGLANEPEDAFAPALMTILEKLRARAVVVGHTPVTAGRIVTRFGGRVIQIDTGMLNGTFFPGGVASALELRGDQATAIYIGRREPVAAPALGPSAPAAPASR